MKALDALNKLGREVPPATEGFKFVPLWGWPLRAMHWAAAISIVVLAVTGFYIGKPYFMTSGEASSHFLMGWMRFLHFSAAAIFVATGIVRLYWMFAGDKYERLTALFPIRPRDWVNLFKQVKYYLMIQPEKAPHYLGHNPLQQFSYTGMYAIAVLMVLTGFTMYGQADPGGLIYTLTNWIGALFGGFQVVRFVHHIASWTFIIFIPIHVYLAMRADIMETSGTISSIFTGGRFVRSDRKFIDE